MAQFREENPTNYINKITMVFQSEDVPAQRRYKAPTSSTEVGILVLDSSNAQAGGPNYCDIVIRPQNDGNLMQINELKQMYSPFSYVLLSPIGQPKWGINTVSESGAKVTSMQYYSFRFTYAHN